MYRLFGLLLGAVVAVSACSSSGSVASPTIDVDGATPGVSSVDTTVDVATTERPEDERAERLGVESPSTTISTDPDEQAAADVVYYDYWFNRECRVMLSICDLSGYDLTRTKQNSEARKENYRQARELGFSVEAGELPPEFTIVRVRPSESNSQVIGVLACQRNYGVEYDPDGNVTDDSSPASLSLYRVVRGDDGEWLLDERITVTKYQPVTVGEDACSRYADSEFPDELAAEFLV